MPSTYEMLYVLASARAGGMHKLTFFTHLINGKLYGGWYRVRSATEVEVQALGRLEFVSWEGRSPEAAAQCCLEEFVAQRHEAAPIGRGVQPASGATGSTLSGCDQGMQRAAAAGPPRSQGSGVYT